MSNTHHHGRRKKEKLKPFWFWLRTTPGWWIKSMMTKPQRRLAAIWQRNVENSNIKDLDLMDRPPSGRKPHHYFW